MLPWRRANWASLRRALLAPCTVAVADRSCFGRFRNPPALCPHRFWVCARWLLPAFSWNGGGECRRATRNSGENHAIALFRLIGANRPRYGGYIVHLSVVMVTLGVLGGSLFEIQRDVVLAPGESYEVSGYELRYLDTVQALKSDRTEYFSHAGTLP